MTRTLPASRGTRRNERAPVAARSQTGHEELPPGRGMTLALFPRLVALRGVTVAPAKSI